MLLGQTNLSNYRIVKSHCRHRLRFVVSSFDLDTTRTLAMLRTVDGLISGSAVVLVLAPNDHHFEPSDLDLYVPISNAIQAHRFLVEDTPYVPADSLEEWGFVPIPSLLSTAGPQHSYPGVTRGARSFRVVFHQRSGHTYIYISGIRSSRYYVNPETGRRVNMIMTTNEAVVAPLLFHSTLVMSFVTWDALVCLYPLMARQCVGLVNSDRKIQRPAVERALRKYRDRGFTLMASASEWVPGHLCGRHRYCGATERLLTDPSTMRVNFSSAIGRPVESLNHRVGWRLAVSRACDDTSDADTSVGGWVRRGDGSLLGKYSDTLLWMKKLILHS